MQLLIELTEIFFALFPLLVVGAFTLRKANTISRWTLHVVVTSGLSLFSMGIALTRLTATCAPTITCAEGLVAVARQPGIFKSCQVCAHSVTPGILSEINSWLVELQGISALLCLAGSTATLVRFVIWARKRIR